mgnify:FL=1
MIIQSTPDIIGEVKEAEKLSESLRNIEENMLTDKSVVIVEQAFKNGEWVCNGEVDEDVMEHINICRDLLMATLEGKPIKYMLYYYDDVDEHKIKQDQESREKRKVNINRNWHTDKDEFFFWADTASMEILHGTLDAEIEGNQEGEASQATLLNKATEAEKSGAMEIVEVPAGHICRVDGSTIRRKTIPERTGIHHSFMFDTTEYEL